MEELDPVRLKADEVLQCVSGPLRDAIGKVESVGKDFPLDRDFHFYSSFQQFKGPVQEMHTRVQVLLSEIGLTKELRPQAAGWPDDADDAYDWLVGVQDDLVEGIDTALDQFSKENRERKRAKVEDRSAVGNGAQESPRHMQRGMPSGSTDCPTEGVKMALLKGGKGANERCPVAFHIRSIPRPQDKFDIAVDNSNTPFKHPQSRDLREEFKKEGASTLEIHAQKLGVGGTSDGFHPLEQELKRMAFVELLLEANTPHKPRSLADTPLTVVSTLPALIHLAAKLGTAGEIAVDLENHHYRSFQGFVCLIQVSTRSEDFIVDALALRSHIGPCLADVFANPSIKKVMHGSDHDILWLQRDFGIYVCNLFDTGQAARVLEMDGFGLAFLLQHFLDVHPDKRYQLADWRIRPLPSEMLKYAREDTHYLLYIHDMLKELLVSARTAVGDVNNPCLQVYQRSRDICLQLYQKDIFTESSYLKLYGLQDKQLQPQQMAVLAGLYAWRDGMARREDESTGYVLPNQLLFRLAEEIPDTPRRLHSLIGGSHSLVGQHAASILEIIRQSMEQAVVAAPISTDSPPLNGLRFFEAERVVSLAEKSREGGMEPSPHMKDSGGVEQTDQAVPEPIEVLVVKGGPQPGQVGDQIENKCPKRHTENARDEAASHVRSSRGDQGVQIERDAKDKNMLVQAFVSGQEESSLWVEQVGNAGETIMGVVTKVADQETNVVMVQGHTEYNSRPSAALVRRAAAPSMSILGAMPKKRVVPAACPWKPSRPDSILRPSLPSPVPSCTDAMPAQDFSSPRLACAKEGVETANRSPQHGKACEKPLLVNSLSVLENIAIPSTQGQREESRGTKARFPAHTFAKPSRALGAMLGPITGRRVQTRIDGDLELMEARMKAEQIRASLGLQFNAISTVKNDLLMAHITSIDTCVTMETVKQMKLIENPPPRAASGGELPSLNASERQGPEKLEEIVMLESWKGGDNVSAEKVPKMSAGRSNLDPLESVGPNTAEQRCQKVDEEEVGLPLSLSEVHRQFKQRQQRNVSVDVPDTRNGMAKGLAGPSYSTGTEKDLLLEPKKVGGKGEDKGAAHHFLNHRPIPVLLEKGEDISGKDIILPFDYSAAQKAMGLESSLSTREQLKTNDGRKGRSNRRQQQTPPPSSWTGTKAAFDPLRRAREDPRPDGIPAAKRRQVFPQTGNRTATFRQ